MKNRLAGRGARRATAVVIASSALGLTALAAADGDFWMRIAPLSQLATHATPARGLRSADYYYDGRPSAVKVELGRLLFFDKLLSGNRNIACATCHHPTRGSGDALSLSLGEGALGLAEKRRLRPHAPVLGRVPRNAQPLYNLGAREFTRLYHDGRVEADASGTWDSGFWSPAREQLPRGLDNVLAAQAMFPLVSPVEMAGHKGENPVATAVARDQLAGPAGAWALLAERLRDNVEYVAIFRAAFDDVQAAADIELVHAANAIAAFEATAFRADASPFDHYLETGDSRVLGDAGARGLRLFYGEAGCARCHSGPLQTDQQFHAIAMPQFGPGKGDGTDHGYWQRSGYGIRLEDEGRYRETRHPADRFRFRTPSLRNVELTAPYGHTGAFATLEGVVRHHLNPVSSLHAAARIVGCNAANHAAGNGPGRRFAATAAVAFASATAEARDAACQGTPSSALPQLPFVVQPVGRGSALEYQPVNPGRLEAFMARDTFVMREPRLRNAIANANELAPVVLTDTEVRELVAFLRTLTDPRSRDASALIPSAVPSGLPVAD